MGKKLIAQLQFAITDLGFMPYILIFIDKDSALFPTLDRAVLSLSAYYFAAEHA
jgi:hypothetical protein